jgi:predicted ester cyclase
MAPNLDAPALEGRRLPLVGAPVYDRGSEEIASDLEFVVMASIKDIAQRFFADCEAGKGWDACKVYCTPSATFSAQAEPLADVRTLQQYADWMKGLLVILPDGSYEVKSFAVDDERRNVCAYAVFSGTHTGPGGPCAPTGRRLKAADYVYVMNFDGDKISHMTKIWHSGLSVKELGWA